MAAYDEAADGNDWQKRHDQIEGEREAIRRRIHRTTSGDVVVRPAKPTPTITDEGEKRVAVYARVSTKSTDQTSSIENQTMYYTRKVEEEPNWILHDIYSDEGKSGTSVKHRENFNRMIRDAEKKEIDLIICASVSRFARNVSDCVTYARQLRSMNPSHPVGVYFETENIYSLDPNSENVFKMHAMLADWESANKSRRMILSYDQRICTGQYPVADLLGYRHTRDGELIIQPEEARTVRFIYLAYLTGYSCEQIAEILTAKARPTLHGRTQWNSAMVRNIMENERRWGDLEARKRIVVDYIEHKYKKNEADRVSAYASAHHEGIVSPEMAKAAKLLRACTGNKLRGIPEAMVVPSGAMKGFVSINPAWNGLSQSALTEMSQSVYDETEMEQIKQQISEWNSQERNSAECVQELGYQVPFGSNFINVNMPSMTIRKRQLRFSKACIRKLCNYLYVELLYHPLLQVMILRKADENNPNALPWNTAGGCHEGEFIAPAFIQAICACMHWKADYQYRIRGISRIRGEQQILLFSLDKPQISAEKPERTNEAGMTELMTVDSTPWLETNSSYRRYRESLLSQITEDDILQAGTPVINPIIGPLPSRREMAEELEQLLRIL